MSKRLDMKKLLLALGRSKRYYLVLIILILLYLIWFLWPMAYPFPEKYSKLIYDRNGILLHAFLAEDEQLRFSPDSIRLSPKYLSALLTYEDKRYYWHPGVDPLSLVNAFIANVRAGKRLRGGSTIPMQIARLSKPKKRTYSNKIRECLTAIKLSWHYSKEALLNMYATHVPMGSNIVGIGAASYRYFGKPAEELSWAEAALFTILPNAPSMINLQKERRVLLEKRNALLRTLAGDGAMDSLTCVLACQEPLPAGNRNLPFWAPHFCHLIDTRCISNLVRTTLDLQVQNQVRAEINRYYPTIKHLGINNLAVLVTETASGKVRAYFGSQDYSDSLVNGQVDGIQCYRSTGSLLKPFLVAKALDRGPYTMGSIIQDTPTFYGTFCPQNASKAYKGLATLEELLVHSLNVPAVRLLNTYGIRDFYNFLQQAGCRGLFRSPAGYGLTLIIGGAEASLWELAQLYTDLANYGQHLPLILMEDAAPDPAAWDNRLFSAGASWLVLSALNQLTRPGVEYYWQNFNNQIPVAWKTGTSYGQKDGWAVGVNRQWTIAVWVGNFTGEGNASLGGANSAAPLLFNIFNAITDYTIPLWFEEPEYDLITVSCCAQSGYPAGPYCPVVIESKRPLISHGTGVCRFHKKYLIDRTNGKSVCSYCWSGRDTTWVTRFILPAATREILIKAGKRADAIPVHAAHCPGFQDPNRLDLLYPVEGIKIFVPRDYDRAYEKIIFSATHQHGDMQLFWYLDGAYLGTTEIHHQLAVSLKPGKHRLVVQDEEGYSRDVSFSAYRN
jgi:penicillin-binding protein 1C